jgi:hypothetical protein
VSGYGASYPPSQCAARCLGVNGHKGPHQTTDGRPLLFDNGQAVEVLAAALHYQVGGDQPMTAAERKAEAARVAAAIIAALREGGQR